MVKDVVVNLLVVEGRDLACDYALCTSSMPTSLESLSRTIQFSPLPARRCRRYRSKSSAPKRRKQRKLRCKIRGRRQPRRAVRRIARA